MVFLAGWNRALTVGQLAVLPLAVLVGQAAGQGQARPVRLDYPIAVTVGNKGAIYIGDQAAQTIYKLVDGKGLEVVYRGSKRYRTPLYRIKGLVQDSAGNLYVCCTGSMDVWRLAPDGRLSPLTGQKLDGAAGGPVDPQARYAGQFDKPMAIALDSDGNPVVADLGLAGIYRILPGKREPERIADVPAPRGIARDQGDTFVVVSHGENQLVRVTLKGEVTPVVKGSISPDDAPSFVHNVVVDKDGYVVSDGYAKTIWRIDRSGHVKPLYRGKPLQNPVGLALEPDGNILVMDPHAKALFRLSPSGQISTVVSQQTLSK